jgi:putative SOS response-associated peptidase YedK
MPVILRPGDEELWLDRDAPVEAALALLAPYPATAMRMAEASELVNRPENDSQLCLDALA